MEDPPGAAGKNEGGQKIMGISKIEWTELTWNPITGCTPVAAGCEHCYAKVQAQRLRGKSGYPADDPFSLAFHPEKLHDPLRYTGEKKVFVCSMGDLFHEAVPDEWIHRVFGIIARCPQHRFMLLTKRPERMRNYLLGDIPIVGSENHFLKRAADAHCPELFSNIWVGVTAENQRTADERIPILLDTPAKTRFVSVEPMLGPVDLYQWLGGDREIDPPHKYSGGLNWVICGGETGRGAIRPMHPDWPRKLRDQCSAAGIPFFFKKWGGLIPLIQAEKDPELPITAIGGRVLSLPDGRQVVRFLGGPGGRYIDGRRWEEEPGPDLPEPEPVPVPGVPVADPTGFYPGPYEANGTMIFAGDGDLIAAVSPRAGTNGDAAKTAQLFAASLEMRDALVSAKWVMDSYVRNPTLPEYQEVEAALRKVGGKSK